MVNQEELIYVLNKWSTYDSNQWVSRKKVDGMTKDSQRITKREIAVKLGLSQECVGHVTDVLYY
jgi:hypothetical protein